MSRTPFLGWLSAIVLLAAGFTHLVEPHVQPGGPAHVWTIVTMACFGVPAAALIIRRLRDLDLPQWLALLCFVPVLGQLFLIPITCLPGSSRRNRHGDRPAKPGARATALAVLVTLAAAAVLLSDLVQGLRAGFL